MGTGSIPQTFIDDLIARVDIVDLIDSRVPLKKTGRSHMARCPFHSEKTPSFSVSREKQFYYCFGCGASGTAIGFLMDYDHLGFVEAVETLAESVGLDVPRETGGTGKKDRTAALNPVYDLQNRVAAYYAEQLKNHPQAQRAIDYLKGRGLSGEAARRYGIGYAPPGWNHLADRFDQRQLLAAGLLIEKDNGNRYDRFRDRIMFPIRDRRARVVGFGGRVLDQSTPKYLNSRKPAFFRKGVKFTVWPSCCGRCPSRKGFWSSRVIWMSSPWLNAASHMPLLRWEQRCPKVIWICCFASARSW